MLEQPQNHLEAFQSFPERWLSTCNVLGAVLARKAVARHIKTQTNVNYNSFKCSEVKVEGSRRKYHSEGLI